jgi:SAM-dependent methyltransferase
MTNEEVKNAVKETYGKIAVEKTSCCGPNCGCETDDSQVASVMMNDKYTDVNEKIVEAADLGLGCGIPTAYADMQEGMTILDLGSGVGIDVFLAAEKVGPTGKAIGLDMTDEMLERANRNKDKLGIANAEFLKGEIENMPIESKSVDRIISNCVINLVPDKRKAFAEMYRVLKEGGKFTVSDIVSIGTILEDTKKDMNLWAGCVAGALDKNEYLRIVREAGFKDLVVVAEKPYHLEKNVSFGLASITLAATK